MKMKIKNIKTYVLLGLLYTTTISIVPFFIFDDKLTIIVFFPIYTLLSVLIEMMLFSFKDKESIIIFWSIPLRCLCSKPKIINYKGVNYFTLITGKSITLLNFSYMYMVIENYDLLPNDSSEDKIKKIEYYIKTFIQKHSLGGSTKNDLFSEWDGHFNDTTRRSSTINDIIK